MDREMFYHNIKRFGYELGWMARRALDDVPLFHNFNNKKSHDHVKRLTMEANLFKNLTVSKPNKSQEQTCDRGKRLTLAAKRLKNLAGNTQNRNESKINLDS